MNKKDRQQTIINLILNNHISNQEILANLLNEIGCNITQATLSRDMKDLKVIKTLDQNGEYIYQLTDQNKNSNNISSASLSAYGFISIEFSNNLAVIKTRPGYAMAIAGEIDDKASQTIIGTVAGDDTILLIPKENVSRQVIISVLAEFIPNI